MNTITLIGRMTKDPELKKIKTGKGEEVSMVCFTLAVDRVPKSEKEPSDFIFCSAFGKTADLLNVSVKKGHKLALKGELHSHNYTNKHNEKAVSFEVVVDRIFFLEPKEENAAPDQAGDPQLPFTIPN